MADTVGQGVVANAINKNTEASMTRNAMEEQKRQNEFQRSFEQEKFDYTKQATEREFSMKERDLSMKEESNKIANFTNTLAIREHADRAVDFGLKTLGDLYRKQESAIDTYNEVLKSKKNRYRTAKYNSLGITKSDADELAENDPDVLKAKEEVEKLQQAFDTTQEHLSGQAQFFTYSSIPNATDLFKYDMSPWELMHSSPEDLQKHQREVNDATQQFLESQQQANQLFERGRVENLSFAKSKGTAEGALPSQLKLQEAQTQSAMNKAATQAEMDRYENAIVSTAKGMSTTVAEIENTVNSLLGDAADKFKIVTSADRDFSTQAKAYYLDLPPAVFQEDTNKINELFKKLKANSSDNSWLINTFPEELNALMPDKVAADKEGNLLTNPDGTYVVLDKDGKPKVTALSTTGAANPYMNVINGLQQLQKARLWGDSPSKVMKKININYQGQASKQVNPPSIPTE